jgi:hypothetical protein
MHESIGDTGLVDFHLAKRVHIMEHFLRSINLLGELIALGIKPVDFCERIINTRAEAKT